MIQNKKKIDKDTIWLIIFTVLPFSLLWQTSEFFAEPRLTKTIISGLLGGLGAAIGFGLYSLTKTKTDKTKIFLATGVLILGISSIMTVNNLTKQDFRTCEVCGYKAVDKDKLECNYCASHTWEKEQSFGLYDNKEEWLRDQQLFWFGLDETSEKANFHEPTEDEGFKKDINWQPIITQVDLEIDFKENN